MNYYTIGTTNLTISEIGFGCMSLLKATENEAVALVNTALDAGINYFDTADLYDKGANEALVGKLLKPVRNKVVLATKVGNEWNSDGSGWNWNPQKSYIIKAVEESLRRLQTDYIDLYQLHGGTIEDPIEETIEAFEQLTAQGKIRYYGISSIRPNVIRQYVTLSNICTVMMQYSLLDRRPEEAILEYLHSHHKTVLARGVLAQGLLVDKPAKEYVGYTKQEIATIQEQLNGLPINNTTAALAYVLNNPAVGSAVIGFRTPKQLNDVLTARMVLADPEQLKALQQLVVPKKYAEHR